ncbi:MULTISPECIES: hypothetical protein [Leptolyngbya]|uniref:hypothetical protein n=1 Tax=Leptolyngbya TaxID=47251 RepID=UPI001F55A037|nr:hypothetical protein [Leptolyngbya sp. FACHB-1624]
MPDPLMLLPGTVKKQPVNMLKVAKHATNAYRFDPIILSPLVQVVLNAHRPIYPLGCR